MPAKVERCVKHVYPDLVERFKKKKKRPPSDKEDKELKQSAWGICTEKFSEGGD